MDTQAPKPQAPKRYSIEKLLIEGVQPFQNLTPEQKDDLKRDIVGKGKRLDKMPVYLSYDEILYDGHQRLQILLELDRKTISEDEIICNPKIKGRKAAHMEAIKINRNRRQLSSEAMAVVIWDLVSCYGMSQTAIGKEIGMRQQSVSELMQRYPMPTEEGAEPKQIVTKGLDGKEYTRMPSGAVPKPHPWAVGGRNFQAIHKAYRLLTIQPPIGLSENQKAELTEELQQLTDRAEEIMGKLEAM